MRDDERAAYATTLDVESLDVDVVVGIGAVRVGDEVAAVRRPSGAECAAELLVSPPQTDQAVSSLLTGTGCPRWGNVLHGDTQVRTRVRQDDGHRSSGVLTRCRHDSHPHVD